MINITGTVLAVQKQKFGDTEMNLFLIQLENSVICKTYSKLDFTQGEIVEFDIVANKDMKPTLRLLPSEK